MEISLLFSWKSVFTDQVRGRARRRDFLGTEVLQLLQPLQQAHKLGSKKGSDNLLPTARHTTVAQTCMALICRSVISITGLKHGKQGGSSSPEVPLHRTKTLEHKCRLCF